jgi:hypothetical protein
MCVCVCVCNVKQHHFNTRKKGKEREMVFIREASVPFLVRAKYAQV